MHENTLRAVRACRSLAKKSLNLCRLASVAKNHFCYCCCYCCGSDCLFNFKPRETKNTHEHAQMILVALASDFLLLLLR